MRYSFFSLGGSSLLTLGLPLGQPWLPLAGPDVWIELVCQGGIEYRDQIHYHSIWRDHTRDYGGNFYSVR